MAKPVYYSRKYAATQTTAQNTAQRPAVAVATVRKNVKMGPLLLVLCLLLGVLAVLLVPLMVNGAAPEVSKDLVTAKAPPVQQAQSAPAVDVYETPQDAMAVLGISAALPAQLPEGFALTECRVLDGTVMELAYTADKTTVLLRVAAGSEDLSGQGQEAVAYTATETVDGIARSYTGVSEKKLSTAVWVRGDTAYAVVVQDALDAALMKEFAESIA